MIAKRKAVVGGSQKLFESNKTVPKKGDDESEEQSDQPDEEEEQTKEKTLAEQEKELADSRSKELRSMFVDQLKELMTSYDLEPGNRKYMEEKIVAHEAKLRKRQRAKDAEIRSVIVSKKEELEALSSAELKKACDDAGVKGVSSKADRVHELVTSWHQAGGVEKALQKSVEEQRHKALSDMDGSALLKLCKKAQIDPYVKEVMIARIVRKEHERGRFARPSPEGPEEPVSNKKQGASMVDQFLAQEAIRKEQMELNKQREEAAAKRIKELAALPVEKLKKLAKKHSLDGAGLKNDIIKAMLEEDEQKAKTDARRQQLGAMGKEALSDLAISKGLKKGSIDVMVNGIMELEEKRRAELSAYESKLDDLMAKKKTELEAMSAEELKELCSNKGLKLGTSKGERVTSLIGAVREDDEVHEILEKMAREARKTSLFACEKPSLLELCAELNVDPLVPQVMVELVFEHEIESGSIEQPVAKKARVAK